MSLFDDNYAITMEEAAAKAKKAEDTADDDEKEVEGGDDDAAEGDGEDVKECGDACDADDKKNGKQDAEEASIAVDIDMEADSIEESVGFERLIDSEVEESHFACLEAVTMNIAFDRTDIACTEAYKAATTDYEKTVVTEKFTESVKKYAERFKNFISKIKNLVIRIFNKIVNYIKVLAARVNAKLSSLRGLGDNQKIKDGTKIKVVKALLDNNFSHFADLIKDADKDAYDGLISAMGKIKTGDAASIKNEIDNIKPMEKADVVKTAYDPSTAAEMDLGGKKTTDVKDYIDDLKQAKISDATKAIKTFRDEMWKAIGAAEKDAKSATDIDTAKMTCITAAMNKLMSIYNRRVNAAVTVLLAWVNARAKVARAAGWKHVKESAFDDSGSIFDKYFNSII